MFLSLRERRNELREGVPGAGAAPALGLRPVSAPCSTSQPRCCERAKPVGRAGLPELGFSTNAGSDVTPDFSCRSDAYRVGSYVKAQSQMLSVPAAR